MGAVRVMRSLGATLLWVAGVVLVATVAWVAINSAGRQVVDVETVVAGAPDDGGSWGDGGSGDAVRPSAAAASPTPTATTPAPPATSAGPPATPGDAPGTPQPTAQSSAGGTPAPPPTSQGPVPVSATQQTAGGSVWLECTGAVVSNSAALPADDWSANRALRTPSVLEVEFKRSSTEIEVRGTCSAGRPAFTVKVERDDDDHHDDD